MNKSKPVIKTHAAHRARPVRNVDLPLLFERQRANDDGALEEPSLAKNVPAWHVRTPVFQWEIDPTDTERPCGSAEIKYRGWDFRMWWERHPAGLVYASIQATRGGRESDWQGGWTSPPNPTPAVTLVYDEQRQGFVSVQGNAQDLRPFIDAFLMGFGVGPSF